MAMTSASRVSILEPVRHLAGLAPILLALLLVGCSSTEVSGGVSSLRDSISDAAVGALEAIDSAKGVASDAAQEPLNQAALAAEVSRSAIGGATDDLSAESQDALEQARGQLQPAIDDLRQAAADARGDAKEALDSALAELEQLESQIADALGG